MKIPHIFCITLISLSFFGIDQKPAKAGCGDFYAIGWITNKQSGERSKSVEGETNDCAWGAGNFRVTFRSDDFSMQSGNTLNANVIDGGGDIYVVINNEGSLGKFRQKLLRDPITKKKVLAGQTWCVQQDDSELEYCARELGPKWKNRTEKFERPRLD